MSNNLQLEFDQFKKDFKQALDRIKQLEVHLGVYKERDRESYNRDDSYFHGDDHFKL